MSAFANGGLLVAAAVAGGIALVTGFRIGSLLTPIIALQVATGLAVTASPFATWSEPASAPKRRIPGVDVEREELNRDRSPFGWAGTRGPWIRSS
jgi:hypothetical protein